MIDTFKILTQRKKGESHRETQVTINWEGITEKELFTLAKRALVYNLQVHIQKYLEGPFLDEVTIKAKESASDHTPAIELVFAPKVARCGLAGDKLDDLLSKLSPEELKELEKML